MSKDLKLHKFTGNSKRPSDAVGIEIEVEGTDQDFTALQDKWRVTSDGSLRDRGAELISLPVQGEDLDKTLEKLHEWACTQDNLRFSERCSVHIHVNVGDLTAYQLGMFLAVSVLFEGSLFLLAGRDRLCNTFCLPTYKVPTNLDNISALLNYRNFDHLRSMKYLGISTNRAMDLNTLEFRMFNGTVHTETLRTYIDFVLSLKELSLSVDNIEQLQDFKIQNSARGLFCSQFPEVGYSEEFEHQIQKGIKLLNNVQMDTELYALSEQSHKTTRYKIEQAEISNQELMEEVHRVREALNEADRRYSESHQELQELRATLRDYRDISSIFGDAPGSNPSSGESLTTRLGVESEVLGQLLRSSGGRTPPPPPPPPPLVNWGIARLGSPTTAYYTAGAIRTTPSAPPEPDPFNEDLEGVDEGDEDDVWV